MPSLLYVATVGTSVRGGLLPYAKYFRAKGWRVDVVAQGILCIPECREAFSRVWEINWSRQPWRLRNLLQCAALRRIVDTGSYDLVHVHTPVAAFVTRYALRNGTCPVKPRIIYTAHGFHFHPMGLPWTNSFFLGLEMLAGHWTDYLVVINRTDEEAARRHRIVSPDRIFYVPGVGIDTNRFCADSVSGDSVTALRDELGLGAGQPLLSMAAEFNPGKRHRDLLRAFGRLGRKELHLVLAGDGPLLRPMRQLASALGIAGQVHFLGFRRDVPTVMRASCATLLCSEREGLPTVVLESMALGIPVIGTDIRGTSDLLGNGAGILVPVGDLDALTSAIAWVVDHPLQAATLAQTARQRAASSDISRVLEFHDKLYQQAL